jgi:hypothetical protein
MHDQDYTALRDLPTEWRLLANQIRRYGGEGVATTLEAAADKLEYEDGNAP